MRQATRAADRKAQKGERGAVLVELALMMPVLVVLLLAVVDLGIVLREYQIIQNAAREGARYSSLPANWVNWRNPGASEAAIQTRVLEYLQEEGISDVDTASITVTQTHALLVGGLTLYASEIQVSYDRAFLLRGLGLLPSPTVRLTGSAVFRNLY